MSESSITSAPTPVAVPAPAQKVATQTVPTSAEKPKIRKNPGINKDQIKTGLTDFSAEALQHAFPSVKAPAVAIYVMDSRQVNSRPAEFFLNPSQRTHLICAVYRTMQKCGVTSCDIQSLHHPLEANLGRQRFNQLVPINSKSNAMDAFRVLLGKNSFLLPSDNHSLVQQFQDSNCFVRLPSSVTAEKSQSMAEKYSRWLESVPKFAAAIKNSSGDAKKDEEVIDGETKKDDISEELVPSEISEEKVHSEISEEKAVDGIILDVEEATTEDSAQTGISEEKNTLDEEKNVEVLSNETKEKPADQIESSGSFHKRAAVISRNKRESFLQFVNESGASTDPLLSATMHILAHHAQQQTSIDQKSQHRRFGLPVGAMDLLSVADTLIDHLGMQVFSKIAKTGSRAQQVFSRLVEVLISVGLVVPEAGLSPGVSKSQGRARIVVPEHHRWFDSNPNPFVNMQGSMMQGSSLLRSRVLVAPNRAVAMAPNLTRPTLKRKRPVVPDTNNVVPKISVVANPPAVSSPAVVRQSPSPNIARKAAAARPVKRARGSTETAIGRSLPFSSGSGYMNPPVGPVRQQFSSPSGLRSMQHSDYFAPPPSYRYEYEEPSAHLSGGEMFPPPPRMSRPPPSESYSSVAHYDHQHQHQRVEQYPRYSAGPVYEEHSSYAPDHSYVANERHQFTIDPRSQYSAADHYPTGGSSSMMLERNANSSFYGHQRGHPPRR